MAESAVSFVTNQLSTWILEEKQLLGSLKENVHYIRDEMSHIKAFLRVADEKEEVDPQLKEWVNQVRDVAYDVEDLMDRFMIRRFASTQDRDGICSCVKQVYASIKNLKARHQIASRIRTIQSRVKSISEAQQRYRDIYGGGSGATAYHEPWSFGNSTWYDGRGDALLLEESEVVGIDRPRKQLLDWLFSAQSASSGLNFKVISVVGTGGLGKTTLVRKVYNDAKVKMRFNAHVWITVSESFKLQDLLRNLIRRLLAEVKQSPPQGLEQMDAEEMKEFVYNFLQHTSYLIVLDDIWKLNAWEAIRYAFPRSGSAYGCIIITTRFQTIAHAASIQGNGHVYNLEPLPEKESNELFRRKAFLGGSCPDYLEEIAGIVLKKCEGLPLAIVVIGSLLATKKNNIEEWNKFHRSLGGELEGNHLKRMTKLLSLGYYDLPYYLKSCFLYLSIFPEDHIIFKSRLIRLWVAEGFVQPQEGKTMEDVAEDYVEELIDRSLIQEAETTIFGMPRSVRVHDLLRTILLSKSKEQSFVTIANGRSTKWPDKSRRLVTHGSIDNTEEIRGCDHLRSVLVLDVIHSLSAKNLSVLLGGGSSLLKVLELRGALSERIPDEVFKLDNLKYLGLKNTKVKIVPKSIGNLKNLETLDLSNTNVTELPVEILRLRRLRNLLIYYYKVQRGYRPFDNVHSFKAPYGIGCFSSLQTLSAIEATQAADDTTIVKEIRKLTQLKTLGIMNLRKEDGKDLTSSLVVLTCLRSLYVAADKENEFMDLQYSLSSTPPLGTLELRGRLEKVPQWIPSLHGLTRLYLRWSRINDDPLESLQNLPNLTELELCHAYDGNELCFKAGGFQKLKKIWFIALSGLRLVRVEEGSMPLLQEMYMWDCKLVEEVPSGIEHLINLQYIDFSDMAADFMTTLKEQNGGDKWKLSHVPKIEVYFLINGEWQVQRL